MVGARRGHARDEVMLPLNANMGLVIPTPIERGTSREKKLTLIVPTQVALPKDLHVLARIPAEVERVSPLRWLWLLKDPEARTCSKKPMVGLRLVAERKSTPPNAVPNLESVVLSTQWNP